MKNCNLSASIVLFNNDLDEIEKVVVSFLQSTNESILYLVDNSEKELKQVSAYVSGISRVEYVFVGGNLGYGGGHNHIMKKLSKEINYHLIMNADVKFEDNVINDLCNRINNHDEIGLIAPKIINTDGTVQFTAKMLPTPLTQFVRRFIPIKKLQDWLDYDYELKFTDFSKEMNVPFIQGSFLLVRTKSLKDVGYFDEDFFMYYEDVDLVRRIHEKYQCLYYPKVVIHHVHNRGSYKNKTLLKYHINSTIKYFNKWGWLIDSSRKRINNNILARYYR